VSFLKFGAIKIQNIYGSRSIFGLTMITILMESYLFLKVGLILQKGEFLILGVVGEQILFSVSKKVIMLLV